MQGVGCGDWNSACGVSICISLLSGIVPDNRDSDICQSRIIPLKVNGKSHAKVLGHPSASEYCG